MSKAKSGGGITSNKVVRVGLNAGAATRNRVSPGAVSKLGASQGNRAETETVRVKPDPLMAGQMHSVPLGNSLATNVGKGGPGKGREVFRTGSQGKH